MIETPNKVLKLSISKFDNSDGFMDYLCKFYNLRELKLCGLETVLDYNLLFNQMKALKFLDLDFEIGSYAIAETLNCIAINYNCCK